MTLPCPENIGNPTPGTDAISLLDIQNEFDGIYPIRIDEYYRDGSTGYVFTNDAGTTDNIPTSGQISFADFFCGNGEVIIRISKNTQNPDVSLLFGKYWTSLRPKRLIVDNGIYVYNTLPYKTSELDAYAMRIWDTLIGKLTIQNYGFIQGAGGRNGGSSILSFETRTNTNDGGQGGNAIYIGPTVFLLNFNRYWNGSTHYYGETPPTTGYTLEASNYFNVYRTQVSNTVALRRLSNPVTGAELLTSNTSEYGGQTTTSFTRIYAATTGFNSNGNPILIPHPPVQTIVTSGYIRGYISRVSVNGIDLSSNQYTATDEINIVLNTPAQPSITGNIIVSVSKSLAWTGKGIVGYVFSSSATNRVPIYRSKNSSVLASDYLLSTSSTEGTNAGYISEGIAFYAPPATGLAVSPKPSIYIENYGQIAAGGGGGGKGGDGGSVSFSLAGGYFIGTVKNIGTVGGLGQGYGQVNTSSNKNLVSSAQNVRISTSEFGSTSVNIPSGSDDIQVSTSGGGITLFIASNTSNIRASSSGGGITAFISPYVTNVTLSTSGGGVTVYVSSNTSGIRASSSGGGVNVTGAGAAGVSASSSGGGVTKNNNGENYPQNITNLSAYLDGEVYDAPSVSGAAGAGGDGGTFGNPGGNGQNGSTSNGSPGGPTGVAIYGISYVVGGVTGNAVLGSTTE